MKLNQFKKLIEKNTINFNELILNTYFEIGLDELNAIIIIKLHEMKKNGVRVISPSKLIKVLSIDMNTCLDRLEQLIKKGYLTIEIDYTQSGKQTEIFSLDLTFEKILKLMYESEKDLNTKENNTIESKIVKMLESEFSKPLTPLEIEVINKWIQEDKYTFVEIKDSLLDAVRQDKVTLQYVDAILLRKTKRAEITSNYQTTKTDVLSEFYQTWKK